MKTIIIDGVEYNLTPKARFKKGDWCIDNEDGTIFQIVKVLDNTYTYRTNKGKVYSCSHFSLENDARLWDIAKDAKDGDVLAFEGYYNSIVLFQGIGINGKGRINYHCKCDLGNYSFGIQGDVACLGTIEEDAKHYHPATKEQRDTLERAITNAGYRWDDEKKELKIIDFSKHLKYNPDSPSITKQNPAWSEEDEKRVESLHGWLDTLVNYIHHDTIVPLDLRRERMQQVERLKTWLKLLKEMHAWKPSDEQMEVLPKYAEQNNYDGSVLTSLYQELKKLKE